MTNLPDRRPSETASALPPTGCDDGSFFEDEDVLSLQSRAMAYLGAGVPVHLRGPSGMGKTTLALRIADRMGRPVSFLTGDRWLTREDLVGREIGRSSRQVVDSYISRVRRTETQERSDWQDAILADAMRLGHTLVYDEFTRASPQANAVLLSVLEEGVLVFHDARAGRQRLEAHPEFRMILTSNPHDYVGVEHAPDALIDRVVTFDLEDISEETECGIVATRTGLAMDSVARLVSLVRSLRGSLPGTPTSMRTALLLGRLVAAQGVQVSGQDANFVQICVDVLRSRCGDGEAGQETRQGFEAALKAALRELPALPAQRPDDDPSSEQPIKVAS